MNLCSGVFFETLVAVVARPMAGDRYEEVLPLGGKAFYQFSSHFSF
jgi:hypothetical protein